jgi:hypothetical protein
MQNTKQNSREGEDKLTFIKRLHEIFSVNYNKRQWILSILLFSGGLILLILFIFLIHHQGNTILTLTSKEDTQEATILRELNDVDSQLNNLSIHSQNKKIYETTFKTINADLDNIKKSMIENAKHLDVEKVSTQIESMKSNVDAQMVDLKRLIASGMTNKDYLDPKILPFRVVSIDVISEEPFVSIDYDNHVTPLGVGDAIAGWTITSADYDSGTVEFKNNSGKFIKETLTG